MNPFVKRRERLAFLSTLKGNQTKETQIVQNDETLFSKCLQCEENHTKKALAENFYVCPSCGYHFKISAYYRLSLILDKGTFYELDRDMQTQNRVDFPNYLEKIAQTKQKTALTEAVVTATGRIDKKRVVVCVLDSRFLMGSMGAVVGEKITRATEYATSHKLPLIIFSASGGARMQEGIISLMQMAKTSAACQNHSDAGLLYISVFTNPTTGGVTASFASLGDINLAEPGALIGFAGPRVIEQTIHQKLPEGFQTAEYVLECGFVDSIVQRSDLKKTLSNLIKLHTKKGGL